MVSDTTGVAGLRDLLPVEILAALVSLITTLVLIRIARTEVPTPLSRQGLESHVFRLHDGRFLPLSDAARVFQRSGLGGKQNESLFPDTGGVADALRELEGNGTAFGDEFLTPDGRAFDVSGRPVGNTPLVTFRELGEERRRALELAEKLKQKRGWTRRILRTLDKVPIAVWRQGGDGQLKWTNAAYRDLDADGGMSQALAAEPVGRALRIQVAGDNRTHWLDVSHHAFGQNETIGMAIDVTPQVEAEASLARFVETLTVTFAHLPIGLAIFDHDRRLGMFNPALSDLLKLDPAWLAGQPTLREFLEHLRENRQMPDQKDFVAWRRQLSALEEGAASGNYSEIWILPSGQNFRVTGRPHPQGALAFLFEDISGAVHLEAQRRAENTLNQSLMDRLSEAIAIFDTSGRLSFCNNAFRTLWGNGAPDPGGRPEIAAMAEYWQGRSEDTGIWAELQSFASGATDRTSWSATIRLLGGPSVTCLFAPMPDGSTLTVFQIAGDDLIPAIARKMEDIVTELDTVDPQKFFAGLEDILLPRGVRLDTARWNAATGLPTTTRGLRRIAWNMILAVLEFAPDAQVISISRDTANGCAGIVAQPGTCGSAITGEGGIAVRVLKQFVDRQGGALTIDQPTASRPFRIRYEVPQREALAGPDKSPRTVASRR